MQKCQIHVKIIMVRLPYWIMIVIWLCKKVVVKLISQNNVWSAVTKYKMLKQSCKIIAVQLPCKDINDLITMQKCVTVKWPK